MSLFAKSFGAKDCDRHCHGICLHNYLVTAVGIASLSTLVLQMDCSLGRAGMVKNLLVLTELSSKARIREQALLSS